MKRILLARNVSALRRFISRNPLLVFDFDGTLAPIVRDPERAAMRRTTEKLLHDLAMRFRCAVVSGRARADLKQRVASIDLHALVGNHGFEMNDRVAKGAKASALVRGWIRQIRKDIPPHWVYIEDKTYTLSVHYKTPSRGPKILGVLNGLTGARIIPGKQVYNVIPGWAPDKGWAVRRLVGKHSREGALYVGDDDTDEYAFALRKTLPIFTIRVGKRADSNAEYYLDRQQKIDQFLRLLLTVQRRP